MKNEWVKIPEYDYEISLDGRVRSVDRVITYTNKNGKNVSYIVSGIEKVIQTRGDGYKTVELYRFNKGKAFLLHRLLAVAFLANPENKPIINHKDGNPANNTLANLEWCTQKENIQHAHDTGLIKMPKGSRSPLKKAILQLDLNNHVIKEWDCIRVAARDLNINHYCIVNVCAGRETTYKGYKWKYAA